MARAVAVDAWNADEDGQPCCQVSVCLAEALHCGIDCLELPLDLAQPLACEPLEQRRA